jgi:hypothetical protein
LAAGHKPSGRVLRKKGSAAQGREQESKQVFHKSRWTILFETNKTAFEKQV